MTIIYISTPYFADCDFPLIKELRKQGCKVIHIIPITPKCLKSTLIEINQQYPLNGIFKAYIYKEITQYSDYINDDTYILNRTYTNSSIVKRLVSTYKLYKFINSFKYDYVWTSLPFGLSDILLYKLRNIILTVHDPFPHTGEQNFRRSIVEHIAYRYCKKFILLNNKQLDKFSKTYKINPDSIIPNKLGTYDCIKSFTKFINNHTPKQYILFYGRISPYKGIEYLLEAFEIVHQRFPELNLIIAGNGKYHFDITEYKKLNYIEFKNYHIGMQESAELFHNAKFVVCPYTDATQSGVVMTAFTMNKAVIASNVGALGECVINNETGLLISPRNSKELSQAIIKLYEDNAFLRKLEENIKNKYSEGSYSWKNIAKQYISSLRLDSNE